MKNNAPDSYIYSFQDGRRAIERRRTTEDRMKSADRCLMSIDMKIITLATLAKILEITAANDTSLSELARDAEILKDTVHELEKDIRELVKLGNYEQTYKPISSTFEEELDQIIERRSRSYEL